MNPILSQIHQHRSIRKFKPDPILPDQLERILNAAVRASSSGNMQAFSIIVTEDAELRKSLMPAHFHQSMVTEAPVLLTFCADFHRMRRWLELREAPENFDNFMSFMIAAIDATLASQNAALAAEAEGLGICYMGTTLANCHEIGRILNCPSHVVPVVGFSLGIPDEDPPPRDRLPLKGLIHHEKYQRLTDSEVLETYIERETKGWERYMAVPELRSMVEKSGVQNLAQIYTKLKYTRKSHLDYSETVTSFLKVQGFM